MIDLSFQPSLFRAARDRAGITREVAAVTIGFSVRALAGWESGESETEPRATALMALATLYRCELRDFYGHDVDGNGNLTKREEVSLKTNPAPTVETVAGRD